MMFYGHNPFNFSFHNALCGVLMLGGLGLIIFGVNRGFINDELGGILGVLFGCGLLWFGYDNLEKSNGR